MFIRETVNLKKNDNHSSIRKRMKCDILIQGMKEIIPKRFNSSHKNIEYSRVAITKHYCENSKPKILDQKSNSLSYTRNTQVALIKPDFFQMNSKIDPLDLIIQKCLTHFKSELKTHSLSQKIRKKKIN
jgi:hypothetical protein